MKKMTKIVLVGLLAVLLATGAAFGMLLSADDSILNPAHTFVKHSGSNAVELSKDAVRTGPDTWEITLGVTNLLQQELTSTPIEVALVIDTSGSMGWDIPGATSVGTARIPELNATVSVDANGNPVRRLDAAKLAAIRMINDLADQNVNARVTLTTFGATASLNVRTGQDVRNTSQKNVLIAAIRGLNANGNTNLQGGLLKGISTFYPQTGTGRFMYTMSSNRTITISNDAAFSNSGTDKIMVVLTDGAANRYYDRDSRLIRLNDDGNFVRNSNGNGEEGTDYGDNDSSDAANKAATAIKNKGVTIYSVGFAYSDSTLEGIASPDPDNPPNGKLYYHANDAVALAAAFQYITNQIGSSALEDPMGDNLIASGASGADNIAITGGGGKLSWDPTAADLAHNKGNFITYTVTLDYETLAAGDYNNWALNGDATFGVTIDGTAVSGPFPRPTAEFDIGTLDVKFMAGSTEIADAEGQQKVITDWTVPGTFDINDPPETIDYNGQTYYYSTSQYDTEEEAAITADGTREAAVGAHTLVHKYTLHLHDVTYSHIGTEPIVGYPALPAGGSYAAGTVNIPVAAITNVPGYTFTGWSTTDVTVTGGEFTMPDQDVEFTGFYTPNSGITYKVEHYKQNSDGTFSVVTGDTETKNGTTGAAALYAPKSTYEGFTYQASKTTSNNFDGENHIIKGDGSLVIKLYYTLNTHDVSYKITGDIPTGGGTAPAATLGVSFGATVTVAQEPTTPAGYTFSGWSSAQTTATAGQDFTMPDDDVLFTGSFTANTNTEYKVEHYQQNLDGTFTTPVAGDTETKTGTTDTVVVEGTGYAAKTNYAGFTYQSALTTSNNTVNEQFIIAGDGSLVIKLYYTRNNYNVSYEYDASAPGAVWPDGAPVVTTLGGNYAFGSEVGVKPTVGINGYTFHGWTTADATVSDNKFAMPAGNVVFKGYYTANTNTEYKVEHYQQNLGDTDYTLVAGDTETKTGTTGTVVVEGTGYAAKTNYTGFTYQESLTVNGAGTKDFTITGDGLLVIKLYYTRNNYNVSYEYDASAPGAVWPDGAPVVTTLGGNYAFGSEVGVKPTVGINGYTFHGWTTADATVSDNKFAMPAGNVVFKGYYTADDVGYTVEYYLQKLGGGGYDRQDDKTDTTGSGLTGSPALYSQLSFPGFKFEKAESNNTVGEIFIIKGDGSLVIKVYYTRESYEVSYSYTNDVPGKSALPLTIGYSFGATVTVADNATAPGYNFGGWSSTQVSGVGEKQTFTMPAANVVFSGGFTAATVNYKIEHYKQNFDGTFPTTTEDIENKNGTTGTPASYEPKDTATGDYLGFFYQESSTVNGAGTKDFTVTGDGLLVIKLYYTRNSYNVTYSYTGTVPEGVSNPGSAGLTIGYSYGANVAVLTPIYPDTHTFSGWTPTGIGVSSGSFSMPANDVEFVGSFDKTPAEYTVKYYLQGTDGKYNDGTGTTDDSPILTIGATGYVGDPATFVQYSGDESDTDYREEFNGFTYASATPVSPTIPNANTLVIRVYYTRNSYPVSYEYDTAPADAVTPIEGAPALPTSPHTGTFAFGTTKTVAPTVVIDGYTFHGWAASNVTADGNNEFTMPKEAVVFKGYYTANTDTVYKVEHYQQNLEDTDFTQVTGDTENKTGTTGTAASYTPKTAAQYPGFTYDEDLTTSESKTGEDNDFIIAGDGSLVIKLYYTRNANYTYTVEYRKDSTTGAKINPDKTVSNRTWGETCSESAIAIHGYAAQTPLTQTVLIDQDNQVIIFVYKANKWNVTYVIEDPIPVGFDTSVLAGLGAAGVEFGTAMTVAGPLSFPDYNFTGWTTGDAAVTDGSFNMPDNNVVFKGSFTKMPAWVVYEYTGDIPATAAALPATSFYNVGNAVTIAANPAAVTGFTFEGWTRDGSPAANFTIGAAGEYKVIGNWVRNSYKVTYQYDSSAPATAPALPTEANHPYESNVFVDTTVGNITGYTFNGWVPTTGIGEADITDGNFAMPANDVVFTGSWTANRHNVTYQLIGEIPPGFDDSVLATYGASGIAFDTPMTVAGQLSHPAYKFHGWTSNQVTPVDGNYNMPDSDVLFTGYFTANIFKVSYVYIGDVPAGAPALPAGGSYEVGSEVTAAFPVSLAGYTFYGWQSDVSVTAYKFTMPARDVVFVGWWTSLTSSVYSEPSYYSEPPSIPSTVPSSAPASVASRPSSAAASSRPTISIVDEEAPLDVIEMGDDSNILIPIILGIFSAIALAAVILTGKKARKTNR